MDSPDPPTYITSVPSASPLRKKEADSQAVVSEWQITYSKRFNLYITSNVTGNSPETYTIILYSILRVFLDSTNHSLWNCEMFRCYS